MKIILTESQFNNLLLESQIEEAFLNFKGIEEYKELIRRALMQGVTASALLAAVAQCTATQEEKKDIAQYIRTESYMKDRDAVNERARKIDAVKAYMEYALQNQGYSMNSTELRPETLVDMSEKYHFDLPFLLASAHYESCFGATNRAQRTNSVFSVGSYDDGSEHATYSDPNESVEPFIKLLQKDYLQNGKTINHLMKPNGYVNMNGDRYGSNENYESDIRSIRNKIINMYPILES